MTIQLQPLRHHLNNKANSLIISSFTLLLPLSLLISSTSPAFAQTAAPDPRQALTEEIKLLADRDVENDIPRRTNFIVQIYSPNAAGLTSPQLSQIYDEAYSEQVNQKNLNQKNLKNTLMILGIIALLGGLATVVLRKTPKFKVKSVSTSLPFGLGQVQLETDEAMRKAAWALYVELTTRITTQTLASDQGLLREALSSLYSLFASTREILKQAGPDVGASLESVGGIAIAVLNQGIRPFVATWHPKLKGWEEKCPPDKKPKEYEDEWDEADAMRDELAMLRQNLAIYVKALEDILGIKREPDTERQARKS